MDADTAEVSVHAICHAYLHSHKKLNQRGSCTSQFSEREVPSPRAIPDMGSEAMAEPIAYINGKRFSLPTGRAEVTLLQYLRGVFAVLRHACTMKCPLEAGTELQRQLSATASKTTRSACIHAASQRLSPINSIPASTGL